MHTTYNNEFLMLMPLPQCGRGLGYEARITDYKSEDSVRKLLDPVEAEMAMVSWGFLDSVMVACPWMQAPVWAWARLNTY